MFPSVSSCSDSRLSMCCICLLTYSTILASCAGCSLVPYQVPTQEYNELTQGTQWIWIKIGPTQHWFQAVVKKPDRTGPTGNEIAIIIVERLSTIAKRLGHFVNYYM